MGTRILLFLASASMAAAQSGVINTIAGGGIPSGVATNWGLAEVLRVAVDASGNLYVAVNGANQIWVVNSSGTITQVIGNGTYAYSGDGGAASQAGLANPEGVAVDSFGNIYIADTDNNRIRKVSGGIITTIAGNGTFGDSGDGGTASNATLGNPSGIAVDSVGNVYFVDNYYNSVYSPRIREISLGGVMSTVAGGAVNGFSGDGGPATSALLGPNPGGVALDSSGNLYIADTNNCRIRKITGGIINTIAGNGTCGYSGDGRAAIAAELYYPEGVAIDSSGNVYIADEGNQRIRKVSAGNIRTIAGNGTYGYSGDGGVATSAGFASPYDVVLDFAGNIYISDAGNNRVRKISAGIIATVVGNGTFADGGNGAAATGATLFYSQGVAVDSNGNIYVADTGNCQVREVSGGVIAVVAGTGTCGYNGDGIAATSAELDYPQAVAVDSSGNVYIADTGNQRVREVSGGIISTIAGNGTGGYNGDGIAATSAELFYPSALALDSSGNVYIADTVNQRIREVSGGNINTIAGTGAAFYNGDGIPATAAQLAYPQGVAVDSAGNIYIADQSNQRIREISRGNISTIAGNGTSGYNGDGLAATSAELSYPSAVFVDFNGNVYIADELNQRIREVSGGLIATIGGDGTPGFSGDGGAATSAEFYYSQGIAVDLNGNVYVADTYNHRIREIVPPASQTINFGTLRNQAFGAAPFFVGATATSGLTVSFHSQTTAVCTMSGTTVTLVSVGQCTIQATQAGNANFAAAAPVNQSFQVTLESQTINFGAIPNQTLGTVPFTVSAAASSGLPVSFNSQTTSVCTMSNATVTLLAFGQCTIQATQAGNADFAAAMPVNQSFQVTETTTTTLSASPNPSVLGSLVVLNATVSPSSATGTVIFYDGPTVLGVAPISSGVATFNTTLLASGSRSLTARYVGGGSAPDVPSLSPPWTQTVNALPADGFTVASGSPIAVGAKPASVAAGDFNGDGIADLAIADNGDNTVTVFLGNGSGGFSAASGSPIAIGTQPASVAVADFNGDGNADLAIANQGDNTVTVLLGNGSGAFTPATGSPFGVGTNPESLLVADFNGDGFADLAIANFSDNTVTVLLGNGSAGFTPASGSPFPVGTNPLSILAGDFNGDGNADLAVANNGGSNVTVLLGNGTGGLSAASASPFAAGTNPDSLAVGDFNRDGIADLAIANSGDNTVTILLGNGSGGFTAATGSPIAVGTQPASVVVADFNGDGNADLAITNQGDNTVSVLLGNGTGAFAAATGSPFAVGTSPQSLLAGDFNGDGKTDLAVANFASNTVTILLGIDVPAQLQFSQQPSSGAVESPIANVLVQVEDANGNLISGSAAEVTIASNPAGVAGTLTVNAVGGIATFSNLVFSAPNSYTLTASAIGLTAATSASIQIAVQANQTITFGALPNQPLGTAPFTVSATASSGLPVSFNSQTMPVCTVSGTAVTLISIGQCTIQATQTGNGAYAPAAPVNQSFQVTQATSTAFTASPNPSRFGSVVALSATVSPSSATGTMTFYDGAAVLAVAPVSSGVATFNTTLLAAGSRSLTARYEGGVSSAYAPSLSTTYIETVNAQIATNFTAAAGSPLVAGTSPASVAVGDFNGDGNADLAIANFNSNNVTVFLGNGGGSFTAASGGPFAVGTNPHSVAVGDFNGDGISDLAVADEGDNNVTVLLGNIGGGFTPAIGSPFAVSNSPISVAVADFNGDGNADLAVVNAGSSNVTVLLGNGSGSFLTAIGSPFMVGSLPQSVAVADFDGDGNADFAVANEGDNTVTVLLGDGSGGFTAASGSPFAAGAQPISVAMGDFNGDGKADLAIADEGGNNLTVLLGNGRGTFTPSNGSPFAVGATPWAVVVGDFNGDGKSDLVLANFGSNNVTVLLGNGSGNFTMASESPLGVGTNPYSIAVGDFSADGKTDLAVANYSSNEVTILLGVDPPTQLQITQQPSVGTAGQPIGNVVVQVEDANGNLISGSTAALSMSSNPAGVSGTLTVNAVGGVATFSNLVFNAPNTYALTASAAGLTSATTNLVVSTSPPGTPAVVSVSPNPATGLSNTFALTYSDTGGNASLNHVGVIFNPAASGSGSCEVLYYPAVNLLYLVNDAGAGSTNIVPGSGALSNSQCSIIGSGTSVVRSGSNLTLNLAVTASSTYTGKQNIFMYASDNSSANTGWVNKGTWTPAVNQPPAVVSATPNPASGLSNTFALTYSDPNGATDLNVVGVIFNSGVATSNSCAVLYYATTNALYLLNDTGAGSTKITPGSGTLSNSQCTITGSGTSIQRSGNNLTLNLAVTASSTYTGRQNVFMLSVDNSSATTGWVDKGTWTPAQNQPPAVVSATPNPATGLSNTFGLTYSDPNGAGDLNVVKVIFNSAVTATNSCYVLYAPASNLLYLLNDAGTGSSSITPGSGTLSNSQCSIAGSGTSAVRSGDNLTLNLAVTANPSYTGAKGIVMNATDNNSATSGWVNKGTWTP